MNNVRGFVVNKTDEKYLATTQDFSKQRLFMWQSIYWQAREPIRNPEVQSVLEFGPGRGVTKALIEHFGIRHVAVDRSDKYNFKPDVHKSIDEFITDEKFDMVCAFQVLEHNPIETLKEYLEIFKSFTNKYIYISLPYNGRWFSLQYNIFLPGKLLRGTILKTWQRLFKNLKPVDEYQKRPDKFNAHWYEVGDKNFTKEDARKFFYDLDLEIVQEYHCISYPHHIFYLMKIK